MDCLTPFDDDELAGVGEFLGQIFHHDARVLQAIKIVVGERATVLESVRFRNGKTGACNWCGGAEGSCETADKSGLTSTYVTDEFDDARRGSGILVLL